MLTLAELRSVRIGPYSLFDTALGFVGMAVLSPFLNWMMDKFNLRTTLRTWLLLTLPIALTFHLFFRQNTRMTTDLIDLHGHIVIKLIVIACIFWGLRSIKKAGT